MLTEKEQQDIIGIAKKLAKVYHEDRALSKRIGEFFNGKTKAIKQVEDELIEYLKEAG
jgi:hypothetical protein